MGDTAKGLVPENGNGELKMPSGVRWCNSGTTGMRFPAMLSYDPDEVMKYLINVSVNYPKYQPNIWDCEDHAFLAAADVRCHYPGQPIGIAIGIATEGDVTIKGFMHAVNYLWFEHKVGGQTKWMPQIYDPTMKRFVGSFDTKVIIPLPIAGLTDHQELPPFEKFSFQKMAAFQLDDRDHKFELIDTAVMNTLTNKLVKECPEPADKELKDLFMQAKYWSFNDRVFYWFAQIRKMHMGAPVGVAFGQATTPDKPQGFEYAGLVLWRSADQFIYWNIQKAKDFKELNITFKPRIVIV